jgi:hypothetical protein
MSRKYIKQQNETNFVYPNNTHTEYDNEIIHDINNNSVSGTVTNFTATTVSPTSITFRYNQTWSLNDAERFIRNSNEVSISSVHCMTSSQVYYKPWRLVDETSTTNLTGTTFTETGATFTITPTQMGVSSFTNGTYYFEIRFIGKRAIYPICANYTISTITPTVTPTPTPSPTPTVGPTPTPTPTPTVTPSNFTTGVTLNVTDTGYIKYNKSGVGTVYYNLTSLGTVVLTDCLDCSSIQVGIPFADLANYTIVNCGNPCGGVTPTPTPTPTTSYTNYSVERYLCQFPGCLFVNMTTALLPSTHTPQYGNFYVPDNPDGYVYKLIATTVSTGLQLLTVSNYASCQDACVV